MVRKITRNVTAASASNTGDVDIGFNLKPGVTLLHVAVSLSGTAGGPCHATMFVGDSSLAMNLAQGWIRTPVGFVAGTTDAMQDQLIWFGRLTLGDWAGPPPSPSVGAFVHNNTGAAVSVFFGCSYEVDQ